MLRPTCLPRRAFLPLVGVKLVDPCNTGFRPCGVPRWRLYNFLFDSKALHPSRGGSSQIVNAPRLKFELSTAVTSPARKA